jgi:probable HAF family extracellular repeat protein
MNYSIVNVGGLGTAGAIPEINGLNDKGAVVGTSLPTNAPASQAFEYSHGQIHDLGSLGNGAAAFGINDQGTVVGFAYDTALSSDVVFIDRHGKMSELAPVASLSDLGNPSINDSNEVTGFSGSNGDAILIKNGKQVDLGSLSGNGSTANDINNHGEIVGSSQLSASTTTNTSRAFIYLHGKMTELGTLGGSWSQAESVNNKGEVVGESETNGDAAQDPFLYEHGKMIDLGSLGGNLGFGHAVNDSGVVVGTSWTASGAEHAFIYKNGVMTDLNSLIPANSGYTLVRGVAINDKGQIVCQAAMSGSNSTWTVLLNPTKA